MFYPFSKIVYDYVGGIEDRKKARVRSIISAATSFVEDCAANAAVGKDSYGNELYAGIWICRSLFEVIMEVGLLEILLPMQAAYFVSQDFPRRDKRTNLLLSLFSNLDRLLAPDKPCHCSLWVSVLVFHKALADHPRDPLVVAAFSIALHSSVSLSEAVTIAKEITQPHDKRFDEILEPGSINSDTVLINEMMDLAVSMRVALNKMTDENFVSRAMIKHPQAPYSDMVFISMALSEKVRMIIECVKRGKQKRFVHKRGTQIDYKDLSMGRLNKVRDLFARIVFDTIYPTNLLQ